MKRKSYAQLKRRERQTQYGLLIIIAAVFLLIGWIEWAEREDRFNHCMYLYGPVTAAQERAAVDKCTKKAGYFPVDYEPMYED